MEFVETDVLEYTTDYYCLSMFEKSLVLYRNYKCLPVGLYSIFYDYKCSNMDDYGPVNGYTKENKVDFDPW